MERSFSNAVIRYLLFPWRPLSTLGMKQLVCCSWIRKSILGKMSMLINPKGRWIHLIPLVFPFVLCEGRFKNVYYEQKQRLCCGIFLLTFSVRLLKWKSYSKIAEVKSEALK